MSLHRTIAASAAILALGLVVTGCTATPEENADAACDAYAELVGAVTEAQTALDESSTLEEIREARESVADAYDELEASLDDVDRDRIDALATAWESFDRAVDDLDDGLTVPEAAEELSDEVAAVRSAQEDLGTDLTC